MKKAWYLWHESQTTCVLLLNFRTFMETPFALNSLPLRQRARWRVRSQVSWRKTCNASALYTIGIHAFFINLRNSIPCNAWIPAIRHARCQKLFLFPQSVAKQKKKAELFCKERLWKDISRSDGKDSTRSTRKKGKSGTDHQRVWDTAEDEPEYPGWTFV